MKPPQRVIDTHQHVFWHDRNDRGLIRDLDENGIETAWLLSWEIAPFEENPDYHRILNPLGKRADGTHEGIPLRDLILARERHPDRFILGYCPHPLLGDAPAFLEAAARMHEVRICGEWKFRIPLDDPRCIELFRTSGKLGMPVVLHLDVPYLSDGSGGYLYQKNWYGGTVDNLEKALQACPETIFIGHAPGFWREISGDAATDPAIYPRGSVTKGGRLYELFDRYRNLFADLSAGSALYALKRDPAHAEAFIGNFSDRLLFGRDYYGSELMDFLKSLSIPNDKWNKLFYGNAERLVPPDAEEP